MPGALGALVRRRPAAWWRRRRLSAVTLGCPAAVDRKKHPKVDEKIG